MGWRQQEWRTKASEVNSILLTLKQEVMEQKTWRWVRNLKSEGETDLGEEKFIFRHEYEVFIKRNPKFNRHLENMVWALTKNMATAKNFNTIFQNWPEYHLLN